MAGRRRPARCNQELEGAVCFWLNRSDYLTNAEADKGLLSSLRLRGKLLFDSFVA